MIEKTYGKHILKRWSNDFDVPIKVYEEPYFSYFIDLYDDVFNSKSKLLLLDKALENFKTEEDFLAYNNSTTDNIVSHIMDKQEYKDFISMDMDKYAIKSSYPKGDIYKKQNTGKFFVSIDLIKANFQTLTYINSNLVDGCKSYDEFISKFTNLSYIKQSKYIRQVIFGKLNPKRQLKIARFLIEKIIDFLFTKGLISYENISMASYDELVFEINECEIEKFVNIEEALKEEIKSNLNLDVDIEIFKLNSIADKYFIREFKNKKGYSFSCVPSMYFAQVFKKYNNIAINDNDLVFVHENKLAKFLESEI